MITILSVGKKHEDWIEPGLKRYEKRLKQPWNTEWVLLPHSQHEGARAREEESQAILRRLEGASFVVLLDERGKNIDSPTLSSMFGSAFSHGKSIALVIGGAYGVTDELHARANFIWSLSHLVFPHQLVRLIATEQIYRAQAIASGSKYHHE